MLRKKLPIALSALGLIISSSAIYAKTAPLTNQFVTIPAFRSSPEFSLTALALKPGASNLNYVIYNKELPAQSPTWTEKEIKPGYSFAFALGGRYYFLEGKDVNLDWTHLSSSTSATTTAPNASFFLGPDYQIGPNGIPIRNSSGNAQFKYDVVNLDVGQYADFGKYLTMRFFGGLSTAFLREQVQATYTGTVTTPPFEGPFSTMQEVIANFSGIGPRFGIGACFNTETGFMFLGEAAASALIGATYSKTNYVSSAVQLQDQFNQSINNQYILDKNVTQVIPGLDAKLGVGYTHTLAKGTILTIKGGYQAAVYINAISQYTPATLAQPLQTGGIFVATMNHTISNYSVQGPFLEGTVQF